jgi:23S rRNA U2552 (ribose-2'-O)-methylase RlmE/FtsJ
MANMDSSDQDDHPLLPSRVIREYIKDVPEFKELCEVRAKGWANPKGDKYFKKQRKSADNADHHTAIFFFKMMKAIANELHDATGVFGVRPDCATPAILDTCAAPGGFVTFALRRNPTAKVTALSLPASMGGHKMLAGRRNLEAQFLDITMLAADMGAAKDDVPGGHPEEHAFRFEPLLGDKMFDTVFCDGQVLRTHRRLEYREQREARRLSVSQLVLGMEHVKPGGSVVILMHKPEAWRTAQLMCTFSKFSEISVFKSTKHHEIRSSFYLVAKNIQPHAAAAAEALAEWKRDWRVATFGTDEEYEQTVVSSPEAVGKLLEDFGEQLVTLAKPLWKIQAAALEQREWTN